jgi:peroxiredoxin
MTLLHPGDRFPTLNVPLTGGEILFLPDALSGGFGVVLFYRGAWWPYCNAQLRAFQGASDSLAEVGAKVVALSVDDEATTAELVATHGLAFPVGHSADAKAISAARARSSTPSVGSSNRPGSSSTPTARWWSASTPRGRSAAWCPTTW